MSITKQQAIYIGSGIGALLIAALLIYWFLHKKKSKTVDFGVEAIKDPAIEKAGVDHAARNDLDERFAGADVSPGNSPI